MKYKKTVLLIIVATIFGVIMYFSFNEKTNSINLEYSVEEHELDIVFGNDTALLEVFMFSSYSCSYCRKFFNEVYPEIEKDYIEKGLVKLIVKPIDLVNNANMIHALKTAVCINEFGNYDKLHKLLILEPQVIYTDEFLNVTDEFINNNDIIAECMLSGLSSDYLADCLSVFKINKLTGTPTFIINNRAYKGFKPYKSFKEILKTELTNK